MEELDKADFEYRKEDQVLMKDAQNRSSTDRIKRVKTTAAIDWAARVDLSSTLKRKEPQSGLHAVVDGADREDKEGMVSMLRRRCGWWKIDS